MWHSYPDDKSTDSSWLNILKLVVRSVFHSAVQQDVICTWSLWKAAIRVIRTLKVCSEKSSSNQVCWLAVVASRSEHYLMLSGHTAAVETMWIWLVETCQARLVSPYYASGTEAFRKPSALQWLRSLHCYVMLNNLQHLALKLAHCRQSN